MSGCFVFNSNDYNQGQFGSSFFSTHLLYELLMNGCFECLEDEGWWGWGGLVGVYEASRSIERADGPLQPTPEKHCRPITHTKSSSSFRGYLQSFFASKTPDITTYQITILIVDRKLKENSTNCKSIKFVNLKLIPPHPLREISALSLQCKHYIISHTHNYKTNTTVGNYLKQMNYI